MNTKVVIVALLIIVIAGAGYFFLTGQNSTETNDTMESVNESVVDETSEMAADEDALDVVEVEMTGEDFRFSTDEISVKVGETVRVVLTANDMPHDFVIDEFDVNSGVANPGETVEVEFTPTEAGEFEFYCSVGQHRANGMVGTLTVTE